ncbi:chemotaxis protein (plasmid) [Mycobacterium paragordonae]|nr:chemotaxis protein [Mycobacterium paragordonae]QNI09805.1 chemotaxis protein [Mycobacterium kubicae]
MLAGSGWDAATVGDVARSSRDDVLTAALADGLGAAAWARERRQR